MNPIQEWIKILWITLIADIGGVASLTLGSSLRWIEWVVLLGVTIGIGLLSMVVIIHVAIEHLLKTGEKDND